jgi:pimeloyl-ACP methyl ester carboxylesterase
MKIHLKFAAALTAAVLLELLVPLTVIAQTEGKGGNGFQSLEADVQRKLVAPDATVVVVKGSGHWLMEEKPKETMAALEGFLK